MTTRGKQSQLGAGQVVELARQVLADPKFPCGLTLAALRVKIKTLQPQSLTAERLASVLVQYPSLFRNGCVDEDRQVYVWSLYPRFQIGVRVEELRRKLDAATGPTIDLTEHAKPL